jgi:hypothetical protein
MVTEGVKRPRREADHALPSNAEVKNGGTITPLVHLSSWYIYGSTALVDLGRFFSFLIYTQSIGLLGRGISPSQGHYLHTEQNTYIHAASGIGTHDPSV